MADSTEIKTMIDSEASKTQGAPIERRKNASGSGNGRRKLTPHPSNPNTSPNNMQVRVVLPKILSMFELGRNTDERFYNIFM